MFIILAYLFLARRYGTSAAPVAPSLADPLANYAPIFTRDECSNDCSCPGRSVWDIVWSCLATTFAVTWLSVHPNVPFLEEKSLSLLKRRIFLMCLALLAPEVMIMWAFKQWRGAVTIRETINKARPDTCVQWTMTHAHFLQMGGFKVNYSEDSDDYWHWNFRYETKKRGIVMRESVLRFYTLRKLLEKQLIDFPDTTVKEIEDRSKSDALSKGVALLQITWFIIQLITRAHQHLTITEIELTTAALAGLNSIMYLFWWSKPLDVRCPIVIRTKNLEKVLAQNARKTRHGENESQNDGRSTEYAHAHSRSAETWAFPKNKFRMRDYLRDSPAWVALDLAAKTLCPVWMRTIFCRFASLEQSIISALAIHLRSPANWLLKTIRILHRQTKKDDNTEIGLQTLTNISEDASETRSNFDLQSSVNNPEDCLDDSEVESQISTTPMRRSHFRRVIELVLRTCTLVVTKLFYLPYLLMFLPMDQILDRGWAVDPEGYRDAKVKLDTKPALQLLFDERDMRWIMGMTFYSEDAETTPLLIFSVLAGAVFGSIHCAAWHFAFPSPVELILWRAASVTIVALCLFIIAISPVYTRFVFDKWRETAYETPENAYWTRIKKAVETPPAIIYPVARLSLLILALLSLRRLPPSAFDTVVWTKFIPHI